MHKIMQKKIKNKVKIPDLAEIENHKLFKDYSFVYGQIVNMGNDDLTLEELYLK